MSSEGDNHAADPGLADAVRLVVELHLGRQSVAPEDRLVEDLEVDSFDLMNIVAILEEDLGIAITEESAASLATVGELVQLVASVSQP